jgi:hypothetical protein
MLSPVVLGVKHSLAQRFGWTGNPNVTWADIQARSKAGELRFGMTNPTASNSGFVALVGVAEALAGSGAALNAGTINVAGLKDFFAGQALTAGISGFLAGSYVLDTSGSMQGSRLNGLTQAFGDLTGADTSITGQFAEFRLLKEVAIILFNGRPMTTTTSSSTTSRRTVPTWPPSAITSTSSAPATAPRSTTRSISPTNSPARLCRPSPTATTRSS